MLNEELMEAVLAPDNLQASYKAVKANKGAAGIDGIGTAELGAHLRTHWEAIRTKLLEESYKPAALKAVRIPKPGGGERKLGIPTTVDRFLQQALLQQLDGIFDPLMSEYSYGFRKGRSAHDAVKQGREFVVEQDCRWVVELDIRSFFDHIDHDILMRMVAQEIRDKRVLKLIGRFLRAGVLEDGKVVRSAKGTPQGGPLSPLLGNIYLDALDKELEARGVNFVRYADDVTIYAGSERSAKRIHASIAKWITKHLKLEVNEEKSGVRPPDEGSFLGFRILPDGKIGLSKKSVERFRARVREHWDARWSVKGRVRRERWQSYLRGWWGYFRLSERQWDWEDLEGWLRRHMRKCIWQQWHNWKGRRNALKRLGLRGRRLKLASSSRGAWRVAMALNRILTNARLRDWGLWVPSDLAREQNAT